MCIINARGKTSLDGVNNDMKSSKLSHSFRANTIENKATTD